MSFEYLEHRHDAVEYLADNLALGKLTLFLGAGGSAGAGLPMWHELIQRMQAHAGMPENASESDNAEQLQTKADEVKAKYSSETEYNEVVRKSLYKGVNLSKDQLKDPLLISIGLLLMGSRRGSVRRVVNFNFDCILEWYISLCGFVPNVVSRAHHLEGAEDVRVYHPHGFLPHDDMTATHDRGDVLILGGESVFHRLAARSDDWKELLRHILKTSVCLFCGMSFRSFRDAVFGSLVFEAGKEAGSNRPLGFWLFREELETSERDQIRRANVVPVIVSGNDGVAEFVMEICQVGAKNIE